MAEKLPSLILMGVTGSGKTTIGLELSKKLGLEFLDGDDFHPNCNKQKMANGTPLDDDDRLPWLQILQNLLKKSSEKNKPIILACSALKEDYRALLTEGIDHVRFVHLHGSFDCIKERLSARTDHFMNPGLLTSQFETLEPEPNAITVSVDQTPTQIVSDIIKAI